MGIQGESRRLKGTQEESRGLNGTKWDSKLLKGSQMNRMESGESREVKGSEGS